MNFFILKLRALVDTLYMLGGERCTMLPLESVITEDVALQLVWQVESAVDLEFEVEILLSNNVVRFLDAELLWELILFCVTVFIAWLILTKELSLLVSIFTECEDR